MKSRDDALVRKMIDYCNETNEAVTMFGKDEEIFRNNHIYRNAACMPIMQIGELCKLVSEEFRKANSQIDWRGWCGVRDIMAHQYTNLDYRKTWQIIISDLPLLQKQLISILSRMDDTTINYINELMDKNGLTGIDAKTVFHKIVDGTGISINAFSEEKLIEYIRTIAK